MSWIRHLAPGLARRLGPVLAVGPLLAAPASAEWFADVRASWGVTASAEQTVRSEGASVTRAVGFEDSFPIGIRAGYWFERLPWLGLSLDFSAFSPDELTQPVVVGSITFEPADIDVFPITPLLMLRAPLFREEGRFPAGRLQPYVALGPGIFIASIRERAVGLADLTDRTAEIGIDARAGLNVQITPLIGIFAEYRYTWFEPTWNDIGIEATVPIQTQHIGGGIGFHW